MGAIRKPADPAKYESIESLGDYERNGSRSDSRER